MGLAIWIFVVIVFLAVVGMFVGFWMFDSKFAQAAENNLLRPFAAHQGEQVLKADGKPQMSCPAGKKMTVIGAVYEVYDPSLECTSKPLTESGTPNSVCGPMSATSSNDQLSGVGGSGQCRIRDVTGQVGMLCNGKETCDFVVDASSLGSYPCSDAAPDSAEYNDLPKDSAGKQGFWVHGIYRCE
ncbi:galactose binding lectin domain-containing protein [Tokyovirus A1]|uniref:galactose binding lectin domain-containing protein n=1 Tax=Tokyovirus A1 TaxID=1826170 RepID=UPI0007A98307|nr:galactose binding lectin domain-containing protein [Tokyovirus A1]BAU79991.1 galactose binding lectin domain-containing protein [Tokyovirus A1]